MPGVRYLPRVHVWGVDVSGIRLSETAAALETRLGLDAPLVTLRRSEQTWQARPVNLGLRLDTSATPAPAYALGRNGSWAENLLIYCGLLIYTEDFLPGVVYDERVARFYLEALARR